MLAKLPMPGFIKSHIPATPNDPPITFSTAKTAYRPHSTRTGPRHGVRPLCAPKSALHPLLPASALRADGKSTTKVKSNGKVKIKVKVKVKSHRASGPSGGTTGGTNPHSPWFPLRSPRTPSLPPPSPPEAPQAGHSRPT
jgi:hypothetical protein